MLFHLMDAEELICRTTKVNSEFFTPELHGLLKTALIEDIGSGDITTNCCIPENHESKGVYRAKEDGVVCGTFIVESVFRLIDPRVGVEVLINDGQGVKKGDIIAKIKGPSRSILTGERVSLNFLQRLSGIATKTAEAVALVAGTGARIVDTRKTTPGLRALEKYAVRMGGGHNHRFNLCDGVLIKDNHIAAAGGIGNAVEAVRAKIPHTLKIEVETANIAQIDEALAAKADIIMLDNMDIASMAAAVRHIAGRAVVEASGNMGSRDLREVAATGVDIISIGALTNAVSGLDISLQFV